MRTKIMLAVLFGAGLAGEAAAQGAIHPDCRNARNRVGCTCALENGGRLGGDGRWTYPNRAAPAFAACVTRRGGATR